MRANSITSTNSLAWRAPAGAGRMPHRNRIRSLQLRLASLLHSEALVARPFLPADAWQPQAHDDADEQYQCACKKPVSGGLARKGFVFLLKDADLDFSICQLLAQVLVLAVDL